MFVGTFFVFRNSVEKFCVSWAFSLVECVAVWALKPPVVSAPLRSLHNRSPPDFLQLIPTYSNPRVTKFFYGITGIQKNWQQTLTTSSSFKYLDAGGYRIGELVILLSDSEQHGRIVCHDGADRFPVLCRSRACYSRLCLKYRCWVIRINPCFCHDLHSKFGKLIYQFLNINFDFLR